MARHCHLCQYLAAAKYIRIPQAYLGVKEVDRDSEQEDHHEEGEELLQSRVNIRSTATSSLVDVVVLTSMYAVR
jgi:hypothetical protein